MRQTRDRHETDMRQTWRHETDMRQTWRHETDTRQTWDRHETDMRCVQNKKQRQTFANFYEQLFVCFEFTANILWTQTHTNCLRRLVLDEQTQTLDLGLPLKIKQFGMLTQKRLNIKVQRTCNRLERFFPNWSTPQIWARSLSEATILFGPVTLFFWGTRHRTKTGFEGLVLCTSSKG